MSENKISLTCNCGDEIIATVEPDSENVIVCQNCGQEYRFYGRSVLRWRTGVDENSQGP